MSKYFRKSMLRNMHAIYFAAIAPANEYLDMS